MNKRKINIVFCFLFTFFYTGLKGQALTEHLQKLSDASTEPLVSPPAGLAPVSYEDALQKWKTPSDVNNWIKENFRYDMERAKHLAENSTSREKTAIYFPAELYLAKKGVCIDLSRFAVETINRLDTSKHVQYLMIEFDPIMIDSSIIRKHWMAVYEDKAGYYLLADSKRPGHIAGPYKTVDDFIAEYQFFRGRKIISWKILQSYAKKKREKTIQQTRSEPG
jgi:hypothetical protein